MFSIYSAKCTGCGACFEVCPQGAISLSGDRAEIDPRRCIECGMCLEVCPVAAIYEVIPQFAGKHTGLDINREGREVNDMLGRGWYGGGRPAWGGFGRGFGRGFGMGRGLGFGRGFGMGRGNHYPYCRFAPSLPRRWWATPHAGYYGAPTPYWGYGQPYNPPYGAREWY